MLAALLVASLTGCMQNGLQAPYTAFVLAPASVSVAWDDSYNGLNDGIGAIILGDFLVYDAENDEPLQNVNLEILSNSAGACLVPSEALQLVDYPTMPEGSSLADCVDENGNFDNTVYEWCAWHYDTLSGNYYQFGSDFADSGGFCPGYHTGTTDRYGLLRVYVYLDALATQGEESDFQNAQIVGTTGYDSDFFEIGPGDIE
ncbi:hypothetical protein L6R53_14685 [Myxococcota bacterium]|nr:hypothetical protein [Myxococcota bacterium]